MVAGRRLGRGVDQRAEADGGVPEAVFAADVEPHQRPAEQAGTVLRELEHVVALEVFDVVEGSLGCLPAAFPECRGVGADGAETALARKIESAEAAHREAADRLLPRVGAQTLPRRRDRLLEDMRAPVEVGAVVVVAVVAAVDEQNCGCIRPHRLERVDELRPEELGRRAAPLVQQDEKRCAVAAA